ncbi:hypothetical protein L218DRAFT_259856 [Marasmius fiardii PR-910]|nr:hypothetical protein L218DRAFT_259856 [Marasmius fiardii PR-910]
MQQISVRDLKGIIAVTVSYLIQIFICFGHDGEGGKPLGSCTFNPHQVQRPNAQFGNSYLTRVYSIEVESKVVFAILDHLNTQIGETTSRTFIFWYL